jgi:hypothetical protein
MLSISTSSNHIIIIVKLYILRLYTHRSTNDIIIIIIRSTNDIIILTIIIIIIIKDIIMPFELPLERDDREGQLPPDTFAFSTCQMM